MLLNRIRYIFDFFKNIGQNLRLSAHAPDFLRYMLQFIRKGGHTITTSFEYKPQRDAVPITYRIQSFIQLDGDMIVYQPHVRRYPTRRWQRAYEKAYQEHQKERQKLLFVMEKGMDFMGFLLSLPIFVGVNYRIIEDTVSFIVRGGFSENMQQELITIAVFVFSAIGLPFVVKWISPYAFKTVWFFVKKIVGKQSSLLA
jgi:hypothetical protein